MDPEERADALAVRARRHLFRDLNNVVQVPGARGDGAEDDKVLGLDLVGVGLVGDGEAASGGGVGAAGVDTLGRLTGAHEVRVLAVVTACRRRVVVGVALVAGNLDVGGASGGELEDVVRVRRVVFVTVLRRAYKTWYRRGEMEKSTHEPPLIEGALDERVLGAVIVRVALVGDVEAPHRRVPWACAGRETQRAKRVESDVQPCAATRGAKTAAARATEAAEIIASSDRERRDRRGRE